MLQNALEKHVSMCRPQNEGWIRVRSALASEGAGRVGSGGSHRAPKSDPVCAKFPRHVRFGMDLGAGFIRALLSFIFN